MPKTSLLRPLENNTGNFFLFSQYTEDLTTEMSQLSHYKVIPSKFAVIKLNNKSLGDFDNSSLIEQLQDNYENSCTFLRTNPADSRWDNFDASCLLWKFLLDNKLISLNNVDNEYWCEDIKYIGDINIASNTSKDGVNFNEIYCHIPTDAPCFSYQFNIPNTTPIQYEYDTDFDGKIIGWTDTNYPANLSSQHISNKAMYPQDAVSSGYYVKYGPYYGYPCELCNKSEDFTGTVISETTGENPFQFDVVILFYDVYDVDYPDNPLHTNLPLGIHFLGQIDQGAFTNTATKYVDNGTIYSQGTSYGLRVVTKYVCQANSVFFEAEAGTDDDYPYPEYARAMSKMAETINMMQQMTASEYNNFQDIKDHLAQFRNYRTNVPYIRTVNGLPHWFVNGRDTGQSALCTYHVSAAKDEGIDAASVAIGSSVSGSASEIDVFYGGSATFSATVASGYNFDGWFDGDDRLYVSNPLTLSNITTNINLIAKSTPIV